MCELWAPLRVRPHGQAGDFLFLNPGVRVEKHSDEDGERMLMLRLFRRPLHVDWHPGDNEGSWVHSSSQRHMEPVDKQDGCLFVSCYWTVNMSLNAPSMLCKVVMWPLLFPRLGWNVWSLQGNMLRQAQLGWPLIKSILLWKQIKS